MADTDDTKFVYKDPRVTKGTQVFSIRTKQKGTFLSWNGTNATVIRWEDETASHPSVTTLRLVPKQAVSGVIASSQANSESTSTSDDAPPQVRRKLNFTASQTQKVPSSDDSDTQESSPSQIRGMSVPRAWKELSPYSGAGPVKLRTIEATELPQIVTNPLWSDRVAALYQKEDGSFEGCFTSEFLEQVKALVVGAKCVALIPSMIGNENEAPQFRGNLTKNSINLLLDPPPFIGPVFVVVEYNQAIKYMELLKGIETRATKPGLPLDIARHFLVILPPAADKKRGRRWGIPCTRDRAHAFLLALADLAKWNQSQLFVAEADDDLNPQVCQFSLEGANVKKGPNMPLWNAIDRCCDFLGNCKTALAASPAPARYGKNAQSPTFAGYMATGYFRGSACLEQLRVMRFAALEIPCAPANFFNLSVEDFKQIRENRSRGEEDYIRHFQLEDFLHNRFLRTDDGNNYATFISTTIYLQKPIRASVAQTTRGKVKEADKRKLFKRNKAEEAAANKDKK